MTSEAEATFEYDKSVIGVDVELGSVEVTAEMIADYCRALDDSNPLFTDGEIIAPPGLMSALSFGQGGLDPKVQFGNTTFMAGTRLESYAAVKPGDTITAKTSVKEVFAKTGRSGTMVFVVRRTDFTNQDDVAVAATEASMVHREVTSA